MATRYIYIPDELNNKLKLETNASGLIQGLLRQYYKGNVTTEQEVNAQLKTIEQKREELNKQLDEEESRVLEIKQKVITEREIEQIEQEKKQAKIDEFKANFFNHYLEFVGVPASEEEYNRFKDYWDTDENADLYSWLEKLGLVSSSIPE